MLVDDHPIVRQGLQLLINSQPDMKVVCEAASATEAMRMIAIDVPDIALIDISLEDRSGIELIKEMLARCPGLPLLALSMHDESLYAERALRAGARGYVMKQEATEVVLAAIRKVLGGGVYLSGQASARLLNQYVNRRGDDEKHSIERLTDRELEVFTMIGRGLSTREIADKLFLSIKTIEAHREHIKEKLHLKSWVELVRHAVKFSLDQGG